jgi:hypothetical protein
MQYQNQQQQQQSNGFGFNPDLSPGMSNAPIGGQNGGSPFLGSNGSSSVNGAGPGAFSFNPTAGGAGLGLGAVGAPGGSVLGGPASNAGAQQQIQAQILAMQQQQLMAGMGMMGGIGAVVSPASVLAGYTDGAHADRRWTSVLKRPYGQQMGQQRMGAMNPAQMTGNYGQ